MTIKAAFKMGRKATKATTKGLIKRNINKNIWSI